MKTIAHAVLIAALALSPAVKAQQPSTGYVFRSVVEPGTIIGGRAFISETTLGSAVLSDSGEVAFVASGPGVPRAVFTSRRIVAKQGDVIGGKYIMLLPADALLAINNVGQVAFEAWYADSKELADAGEATGRGIFVDDHLASTAIFDHRGNATPFTLTDDGRIVIQPLGPAPAPASHKASPEDMLRRIPIKPPKGLPVGIPPPAGRPRQQANQIAGERPFSPPFSTNHRGEILIPVNFGKGGFPPFFSVRRSVK